MFLDQLRRGLLLSWELDDGEAIHREAPATFWIPALAQRESLRQGDVVKLIFRISFRNPDTGEDLVEVERMWVIVQGRQGAGYRGVLDNDPYCTAGFRSGAEVVFEPRHVIQIFEEQAPPS
jgi:hypothetical protein